MTWRDQGFAVPALTRSIGQGPRLLNLAIERWEKNFDAALERRIRLIPSLKASESIRAAFPPPEAEREGVLAPQLLNKLLATNSSEPSEPGKQ